LLGINEASLDERERSISKRDDDEEEEEEENLITINK